MPSLSVRVPFAHHNNINIEYSRGLLLLRKGTLTGREG